MGDKPNHPFQLSFNTSLKADFQGARVTGRACGLCCESKTVPHLSRRRSWGPSKDTQREVGHEFLCNFTTFEQITGPVTA